LKKHSKLFPELYTAIPATVIVVIAFIVGKIINDPMLPLFFSPLYVITIINIIRIIRKK